MIKAGRSAIFSAHCHEGNADLRLAGGFMAHISNALDVFKNLGQGCSEADIGIILRGRAIHGNPQDIQAGIDQFP